MLRYKAFLESVQPGALPGRLAGEDFIEVPMLAAQSEVIGLDVQIANQWHPLEQIEFEQRRALEFVGNSLLFPFLNSTLAQPDAVGVYAVHRAPKISNDALTIVAGALAVWPTTLVGQYQLHSVTSWVDITTAAQLFPSLRRLGCVARQQDGHDDLRPRRTEEARPISGLP